MNPGFSSVVVTGASAGGVHALLEISRGLPRFFPAPVCIVQHVGNNPSLMPELLRYRGPNHAMHVEDGQRLASGTLHVAPPDRHMLLQGDTLRLTHGPKENHARPAIDPLVRSAALGWGSRVIGVILTGQMDDGAAGLRAVHDCSGITIVQDPATAVEPEMPRNALAAVAADHVLSLPEIAPLLPGLRRQPVGSQGRQAAALPLPHGPRLLSGQPGPLAAGRRAAGAAQRRTRAARARTAAAAGGADRREHRGRRAGVGGTGAGGPAAASGPRAGGDGGREGRPYGRGQRRIIGPADQGTG